MLDEPTANLDPDGAAEVRSVLGRVRRPAGRDAGAGRASGRRVPAAGRSRDRHRGRRRGRRRWAAGRRLSRRTAHGWRMPASGCRTTRRPRLRAATGRRPSALVIVEHAALPVSGHARGRRRERRSLRPLGGGAGDHRSERERQVDARADARRAARTAHRASDRRGGARRRARARADCRLARTRPGRGESAPSSRIPSTSSSPGPCGRSSCSGRRGPGSATRSPAARADELLERLRLDAPGGGKSVHPLRRREAAPVGRHRAGDGARRSSCSTSRPSARIAAPGESSLHLLAALRDSGRGIAFVTHDRAFAHALADRSFQLGAG